MEEMLEQEAWRFLERVYTTEIKTEDVLGSSYVRLFEHWCFNLHDALDVLLDVGQIDKHTHQCMLATLDEEDRWRSYLAKDMHILGKHCKEQYDSQDPSL